MSPAPPDAAASAGLDWNEWGPPLERFAAAAELCVSLYDVAGRRRAGPYPGGGVAQVLVAAGALAPQAPGGRFERERVADTLARGAAAGTAGRDTDGGAAGGAGRDNDSVPDAVVAGTAAPDADDGGAAWHRFGGELAVAALPVRLAGRPVAVIVFGWVFPRFTTALGCQALGQALAVDGLALWARARLQNPVPDHRLASLTRLLQSLVASSSAHAEALSTLERLAALREQFLLGVSHELRTPLQALGTRIELLLRRGAQPAQEVLESLERMRDHVATESRLVEDLIDAARTRTGRLAIDPQPTSLRPVLDAALATVAPGAQGRGLAIEAPDAARLDAVVVRADRQRLQQVFWNVLANAAKFTPDGGRVRIDVATGDRTVTVSVRDSGRGIARDALQRIFEPFARADEPQAPGLGLGLSIARAIVAAHGGRIWAESAGQGLGSTFHIELPTIDAGAAADAGPRATDRT